MQTILDLDLFDHQSIKKVTGGADEEVRDDRHSGFGWLTA